MAKPGVWPPERVLKAFRRWTALYGEPPRVVDWHLAMARKRQPHRYQEIEERFRAGRWPTYNTVTYHFSSWSAAVGAAGLPVRSRAEGFRTRDHLERVERGIELYTTTDKTVKAVAEEVGIHKGTLSRHLHERGVPVDPARGPRGRPPEVQNRLAFSRAKMMRREGLGWAEIGRRLGVPSGTVWGWFHDARRREKARAARRA